MQASKTMRLLAFSILIAAVFWLTSQNRQLQQEKAMSQTELFELQELYASTASQRIQFEEQIIGLNRQLQSSAYQLSQLSNQLQETKLAVDPNYEALLQQARREVAQENLDRGDGAAQPFAEFRDPDAALALARENMPRMYDTYINALGIPGTEREQLMNAMLDFSARRYQSLSDLLAGTLSADQATSLFGADALAGSMNMALNSEQQDELRLYDHLLREDTLREVYQMALRRSGTAIEEAMQGEVVETLIDELVSPENNFGALVAEDGSMQTAYQDKVASFERARERLIADMSVEQIDQLDRFIAAQNNGVDVILEASSDGSGRVSITQARIGVDDLPR